MPETEIYNQVEFQKILLREISEKIFDFIAVVSVKARKILFVNEMGAKLFGYDNSDDLLDKDTSDLRKRIPDQKMLQMIDKNINSKGYFTDEIEFVTRKGKSFWGYMQLTSFSSKGEDYRLLQIEKNDITKSDTASLMKEKQRFGALMDYASIGVIILNREFRIVLMNNSTLHLFGYKKKELLGTNIEALIPSSSQEKYKLHLANYFADPENLSTDFRMELCAVTKEGTEFPAEVSIGKFRNASENFAILFINDITIRKKGEDEIRNLNVQLELKVKERTDELDITIARLEEQIMETEKAKAELEKVMQYQKAVLDSSGAIIIATDQNGLITLFNQAAEDQLGYKADEVIGKCSPLIFHDEEETRKGALKYSKELGKNISPGFEVYVAKSKENLINKNEWIYVKKDGTRFPVSLSITALRNNQNKITGFLGVAVDVSETKKTEEELKKALAREIELNEMKSRFVSIASHEFRTPLSTVLSSTYLLQKYTQTDEQPNREKHINRIVSSVNLLTDMLDDLLNVGKIEEGKVSPKFNLFNIKEHIENNIEEIKSILKKGQRIIYNHFGKDRVGLDPSMLTHIVMNLLSNAIKFSPENIAILIESKISDSELEIIVKDQGMGISKEDQQHLFERFYRSKYAADIQGTGLGLYIVQKYTGLMNGKVECKSEPGKGTEFLIKIQMRSL
ncbi:MAG TPA: PAS domain S-box protein [Hanamia sp.]|nr:PAS domain S-box protein [Hanamia sp.]